MSKAGKKKGKVKNNKKIVVENPNNNQKDESEVLEVAGNIQNDTKAELDNKIETIKKEDKTDSKKDDNKLTSKDVFDIREKRIGFVFKIIYVFAAVFIAAFLEFAKEPSKDNISIYVLLAVTVSISLIMLVTMCIYVFHEMKCFKINIIKSESKNNTQSELKDAENSYEGIFSNFTCVLITGISILFICLESNNKFSNEELYEKIYIVFNVSTGLLLLVWAILIFFKGYSFPIFIKILRGLAIIIAMFAITSCLLTVKFQKYRTDNVNDDKQLEQYDQDADETNIDNYE